MISIHKKMAPSATTIKLGSVAVDVRTTALFQTNYSSSYLDDTYHFHQACGLFKHSQRFYWSKLKTNVTHLSFAQESIYLLNYIWCSYYTTDLILMSFMETRSIYTRPRVHPLGFPTTCTSNRECNILYIPPKI